MDSLRLLMLSLKYNFSAQRSNPVNLIVGTLGMIINNVIVLWGLWIMLFDGKPDGKNLTIYFLCLNSIVTISWGSILFFLGGLRNLPQHVEEGTLEPMLSTPRHPLFLVAISESSTPALGDIIQGFCNLFAICYLAGFLLALRSFAFVFVSAIGFMGLFILAGSIPFFLKRGNSFSQLFIECNLSFSFY
ncbi:MAG: ABC-2 family transporter protein, partial [Bdellovibrionales bacterium]|nr:ABC-2 family transporter protein [Bdellovibrionales bacterium]